MTKILNIDVILPKNDRILKMGGAEYKVKDISVESFIELSNYDKKVREATTLKEQVELLVELVGKFIPSLPSEILMQLDLKQLQLVVDFVRDEVPEELLEGYKAKEAKEAPEEEGKDEGK